jgi:TetR/AcrR family tetracycline transcriptional repressor
MKDDRYQKDMARLEEARRRTQERIDQRFERIQARLERKMNKTGDTQERIIEAALELLKEEGLSNLTQRKLAQKLDMQAPALYWYFKNKEELVDYMAEAILQKEFSDFAARAHDEAWQAWLIEQMEKLRKAMLAYPDGARVVAGAHLYPAVTLARLTDITIESLLSAGIDMQTARHICMTATHYTFGYVIEEQAAPTAEQLENIDMVAFLEPYPSMAKAIEGINFTRVDDFLIGLDYIIAGATVTNS